MRLPVTPQISTKDGVSNKNARLTNCLKESKKTGDMAVVRPGLVLDAQASGIGHGLVVFNNELVSVYGATLGLNTQVGTLTPNSYVTYALNHYIAGIVYANSEFVLIGYDDDTESDNFWAYGDGETFSVQNYIGNANNINSVASDGTGIVFISDTIFSATTAEAGNYDFSPATFTDHLTGGTSYIKVRFLGSKYVVVAHDGVGDNGEVFSSADGITWDSSGVLNGNFLDVAFDGTTWWFYGGDTIPATAPSGYSTTDFVTFTPLSLSFPVGVTQIYEAAYGATKYWTYAYDGVNVGLYQSTNGTTFTATTASGVTTFNNSSPVLEVNGGYLYTIADPSPTDASNRHFFRTLDGITWADYASCTPSTPNIITFGAALTVAVQQYEDGYYPLVETGTSEATIPALATITGDHYDFAQSPL